MTNIFAQLGYLRIEEIVDRLGVVLDECLLQQADRAVIFVDLARDDLFDHGGGLALDRGTGDIAFSGEQAFGYFVALDVEGSGGGDLKRHVLNEGAEALVAGDEVGFAIDFDQHADLVADVNVGADDAFLGFATGLLRRGGCAFFAEDRFGGGEVALGFDERLFAIHHARVGFFAELLDEFGRDFADGSSRRHNLKFGWRLGRNAGEGFFHFRRFGRDLVHRSIVSWFLMRRRRIVRLLGTVRIFLNPK